MNVVFATPPVMVAVNDAWALIPALSGTLTAADRLATPLAVALRLKSAEEAASAAERDPWPIAMAYGSSCATALMPETPTKRVGG